MIGVAVGTAALVLVLSVFNGFEQLILSLYNSFDPPIKVSVLEGKVSRATEINSLVISKQTTLFFGLDKNNSRLELLLFWRNKEAPKKLVKLLKGFQTE